MREVTELLERVENATGNDAGLFREVAAHLLGSGEPFTESAVDLATFEAFIAAEAYTDAALALVGQKLPGWVWTVAARNTAPEHGRPWADVASLEWIESGDKTGNGDYAEASAATPALAILAALLRALGDEQ